MKLYVVTETNWETSGIPMTHNVGVFASLSDTHDLARRWRPHDSVSVYVEEWVTEGSTSHLVDEDWVVEKETIAYD